MKEATEANRMEPCLRCGAEPGDACLDKHGRRMLSAVHQRRGQPPRPEREPAPAKKCPSCERVMPATSYAGHRSHCGVEGPGTIWRKSRPEGFRRVTVYLIETTEGQPRVKIGVATDLYRRFQGIQSQSPVRLRLRAAWPDQEMGVEWDLHQAARPFWSHGEWFGQEAAALVEAQMGPSVRFPALKLVREG